VFSKNNNSERLENFQTQTESL